MPERRTLTDADGTVDRHVHRCRARRPPRRRSARARSARRARSAADPRAAPGLPRGRTGGARPRADRGRRHARPARPRVLARPGSSARSRTRRTGSRSPRSTAPRPSSCPPTWPRTRRTIRDYAVIAAEDSDAWFSALAGRKVRPAAGQQRAGDRGRHGRRRDRHRRPRRPRAAVRGSVGDGAVPRPGLPRDRSRRAGASADALATARSASPSPRATRPRGSTSARLPARVERLSVDL